MNTFFYSDDPARDYDRYLDAMPKSPTCDCCGEMVGEEFWEIDGNIYCSECLRACKRYTDEYTAALKEYYAS